MTAYASRVSRGEVAAGPHVRAAALRHLRDMETGHERGLRFSPELCDEAIRFYREILRLNGGEFEGVPFELHESQQFIVGSLFGWLGPDGYRRFRVAYIEQGKGNGKSPLVAGIGLKMLVADGEPRAEVYAFATKKDQAQILFRDAVAMVDQSPELDAALTRAGGKGREWNIADPATASFFRTVASDDAQSGPRPHCAIGDEIHEHKTGLMLEMMRAGTKGRRQALIVMITNSGTDRNSVCWQYHTYAAEVCAGTRTDDAFFGYVCALDDGDDPLASEECWPKANPLIDAIGLRKYLREQVNEARGMPAKEATVRRLNFCEWVEADNPLLSPIVWRAAEDREFNDEMLAGRAAYGGLDLSSTTDLTAFTLLFEPTPADKFWRLKAWFWLPKENLADKAKNDRVPYDVWRAGGWLETPPGAAVNKLFVLAKLVDCCARYDVKSIGFDRWRIEDLKSVMSDEGVTLPLEPHGQGFKDMAPALDEFERLLLNGELRHDGNPILTWNAGAVVVEQDPAGNRKPTKERSNGRIDGIVAACMAASGTLKRTAAPQLLFF